ncbi:DEKNAAC104162 [Brettanomyces naardenensis]|uniref:NEDD8-activating enzyme E1 catalytic subunit n=1 Tax=Brettanomyces naardenensis TaxID=13370 RepID=A0A448YPU2_BRENA|nr:DEKNAAC104162 [Brettanomyces naardenensis]
MSNTELSTYSILESSGPFTDPEYTPEFGKDELSKAKILVVGAGGLGCEILKDLALSSFTDIECIDMDTIELSNLNRQFLFRESDVGKSKAKVAAKFVSRVVKDVKIVAHFNRIQDFDTDFYRRFTLIICGLDNIEARSWINKMVVDIALHHEELIPLIDGGTEGFQGSVKLMIPTITACFECYMKLVPKQTTYPLCTLASTPRLPEHCIEWAHQLEWPRVYSGKKFDPDDPEDVETMYMMSLKRARQFGIDGVTKSKTLGVVKNIIPAIASTNAVIAAACCNEAFKFVTSCNPNMVDSMYYNGEVGVVLASDEYHKVPGCPVCGNTVEEITVRDDITVKDFARYIKEKYELIEPDIFYQEKDLYNFKGNMKNGERRLRDEVAFEREGSNWRCQYELIAVDRGGKQVRLDITLEQ